MQGPGASEGFWGWKGKKERRRHFPFQHLSIQVACCNSRAFSVCFTVFFFFSKDTWFLFHSHTVARLLQKWEENRNLGHRVIVKLASMKEEGMDISTLDIFVAGFTEFTQLLTQSMYLRWYWSDVLDMKLGIWQQGEKRQLKALLCSPKKSQTPPP